MKKVSVVIKWVSHYRLPFYESLKKQLELQDIELFLVYGEPKGKADREKKDWVDIPWGIKVNNTQLYGDNLLWQPALSYIKGSELVIVEQANKLLLNYYLQMKRLFTRQKFAFWGHGRNFQSSNTLIGKIKEEIKSHLMRHVDWWFAYNRLCADEIINAGYPKDKVTSVENSVDTTELRKIKMGVSPDELDRFKSERKVFSSHVGVFCGGMFQEKRLSFLLNSAQEIKKRIPDFEIIFIGAGADQGCVEEASKKFPWVHYLGPLFGKEKVLAMMSAQAYLMPGLVGLGVLDAFALELPVITTDYKFHSPEISYVKDRENGLITQNSQSSYVDAVCEVLLSDRLRLDLTEGCKHASKRYTIENMAHNFSQGIVKCLHD